MLQFPAFMTQFPSSERMIPASLLLQHQLAKAQNEDELSALEESEFLDKVLQFLTSFIFYFFTFRLQFCSVLILLNFIISYFHNVFLPNLSLITLVMSQP